MLHSRTSRIDSWVANDWAKSSDLVQLSGSDISLSKGDDEKLLSDSDGTVLNELCCESDANEGGEKEVTVPQRHIFNSVENLLAVNYFCKKTSS